MELFFLALVAGLASWRVASLLHTEDAFEWLRNWIGIENDDKGYPAVYPGTVWGKLFECFWCLSLVVALPISAFVTVRCNLKPMLLLPLWLAAGAVAIWTEKYIMRTQSR